MAHAYNQSLGMFNIIFNIAFYHQLRKGDQGAFYGGKRQTFSGHLDRIVKKRNLNL
jgi:hypothetical protein